jgi:hypothetical protein
LNAPNSVPLFGGGNFIVSAVELPLCPGTGDPMCLRRREFRLTCG